MWRGEIKSDDAVDNNNQVWYNIWICTINVLLYYIACTNHKQISLHIFYLYYHSYSLSLVNKIVRTSNIKQITNLHTYSNVNNLIYYHHLYKIIDMYLSCYSFLFIYLYHHWLGTTELAGGGSSGCISVTVCTACWIAARDSVISCVTSSNILWCLSIST